MAPGDVSVWYIRCSQRLHFRSSFSYKNFEILAENVLRKWRHSESNNDRG